GRSHAPSRARDGARVRPRHPGGDAIRRRRPHLLHERDLRARRTLSSTMTPKRLFRLAAIAEAITWTLLIAALVVRATTGFTLGVSIAGGIHGFVFLAYGATAILLAVNQRWHPGVAIVAIA